ncbi:unnamed protein product [Protopolystoma xenopodis]|uniref:CTP synthase (glutamine hydrolyzing) n=1 Tax=Protopolystoma xenopodis TaxID=117903 RepID=A0A448WVB0_9PLAT|nr:unnamed protein product [Protopolystoma xenopodis]
MSCVPIPDDCPPHMLNWHEFVSQIEKCQGTLNVAIVGKYTRFQDSYASLIKAIEHAAVHIGWRVAIDLLDSEELESLPPLVNGYQSSKLSDNEKDGSLLNIKSMSNKYTEPLDPDSSNRFSTSTVAVSAWLALQKRPLAVIVPGGFGPRGVEGKIRAAEYCRENRIPFLGICLGFQSAVIEFARNVLGWKLSLSSTRLYPL